MVYAFIIPGPSHYELDPQPLFRGIVYGVLLKIHSGRNQAPFGHHKVRCGTCQVQHVPRLVLRGQALTAPVHPSCTTRPGSCKHCTPVMYRSDGALYDLFTILYDAAPVM